MPDMDRYSSPANRIPQGALCGDTASLPPTKQETASSLLDSCHKYAATIGSNTAAIAHGSGGALPCNPADDCEQPSPSLISSLRLLRNYLANIADESQRVRSILGV